jgi:hypothetical protein
VFILLLHSNGCGSDHSKHRFQQFLYCCMLIRCCGNLFVCDRYLVMGLHITIYLPYDMPNVLASNVCIALAVVFCSSFCKFFNLIHVFIFHLSVQICYLGSFLKKRKIIRQGWWTFLLYGPKSIYRSYFPVISGVNHSPCSVTDLMDLKLSLPTILLLAYLPDQPFLQYASSLKYFMIKNWIGDNLFFNAKKL